MKIFKKYIQTNLLFFVIGFCILLFLPALANFFSGDDWFHLRVIQISSLKEFINFFSFVKTDQSISFYRPVSTQVFFWTFYNIFKLNALAYFLFGLTIFGAILVNIYRLIKELRFSKEVAMVTTFVYGISASNFTRLNFISAFQELFLTLFVLIGIRLYLKKNYLYIVLFILALLSKETAVIFLGLIILADLYRKQITKYNLGQYLLIILLACFYLYGRVIIFKGVVGDSYIWDFSIKKTANTLMWYIFWAFGAPEFLVDYVGSGLKVVPKFFTDLPVWSKIILIEFGTLLTIFGGILVTNIKKINKIFTGLFLAGGFFLLSLLPVIFLPWHKFTHALALPMVGFSLMAAILLRDKKVLGIIFLVTYVIFNLSTISLLQTRHYSVTRGKIAKNIYTYFKQNYSSYPTGKYFRFVNDTNSGVELWGSSKQISFSISGSDFFKVFYKDKNIRAYYDDFDLVTPKNVIMLGSGQFLE